MAVRTRFDPQPKGVRFFSDEERDNTYLVVLPFFLEQMRLLLKEGWKRKNCNSGEVYPSFANSDMQYLLFNHCSNQLLFDISKQKKGRLRRIVLPNTFAHFFDVSKANTWREIFENPATFNPMRKGKHHNVDLYLGSPPPIINIFYLLQVLAPGMLVIFYEYQLHDADIKVSKLLPQANWIEEHKNYMDNDALITVTAAARDRKIAFLEERTERPQNISHHSSLPGTDAVPSSSLPGMDAVPSSSSSGTNALPSSSSLPGTDALPKTASNHKTVSVNEGTSAKDQQKPASQKKKKKPQSTSTMVRFEIHEKFPTFVINFSFLQTNFAGGSNNSSYTAPKYQKPEYYITTDGDGYEYGLCNKDCGWCGRCALTE